MSIKSLFIKISLFCFCLNLVKAAPTEKREWNTTSGHKTTGIALSVDDGKVQLKMENGKTAKVAIDLFIEADQALLRKHFDIKKDAPAKAGAPKDSGTPPAEGLALPMGQLSGPIEANGSKYYVYIPKSLKKNRDASLLFYTHSGGGSNGKLLKNVAEGAELLGWITAISVESKNKQGYSDNAAHSKNCIDHILETLPVDKDRIHYTGNSGGASMAFFNTSKTRAFGVLPNVGYIPDQMEVRAKVVYGLGGGCDYNRYLTAYAASKFKNNGFHRMSPAGHGVGPAQHYNDGMIWMHCKYLEMQKPSESEKLDFEASIINWMNKIKSSDPQRAYSTACIVRDIYEISGKNAKLNDALITELAKDNTNVLYHEALLDINELSKKHFAELGKNGGSSMGHSNPKAAKAAETLKAKYESVPSIIKVLDAIKKPTVSVGKKK